MPPWGRPRVARLGGCHLAPGVFRGPPAWAPYRRCRGCVCRYLPGALRATGPVGCRRGDSPLAGRHRVSPSHATAPILATGRFGHRARGFGQPGGPGRSASSRARSGCGAGRRRSPGIGSHRRQMPAASLPTVSGRIGLQRACGENEYAGGIHRSHAGAVFGKAPAGAFGHGTFFG